MIIEEDAYLAHFGVRGMHWGVRKQTESSGVRTPKRKGLPPKVKFVRNATIGIAVGIGAGIVAGKIVGKGIKIKQSKQLSNSFAAERQVAKLFGRGGIGKVPLSTIRPPAGKGKIGKETASFMADFSHRQSLLNAAANNDLKSLYEKGQVPLHVREYLSSWD